MLGTRDQILQAADIETRDVVVPEWQGITVRLRALTGKQRDAWEASNRVQRGREFVPNLVGVRARLVAMALVDENGERLFNDQQAPTLGEKSGAVLDRLYDIVAEMSGITEKAVENAEGNSETAGSGGSTSDSPSDSDAPSPNS